MVESVTSAVIEKALDTVLRKVSEGRKLSTKDLVVLMLGLFREIRNDIANTNKRIDTLYDLLGKIYEVLIKGATTQRQKDPGYSLKYIGGSKHPGSRFWWLR